MKNVKTLIVVALMGAESNQIFITTILATGLSTISAIIAVRTLERMDRFKVGQETQDD